jgi:SpoVK/Ycf46/Vps4 family AAA+-type ATPase
VVIRCKLTYCFSEILNVDLIQEVSWDKQTFKHLVADPDTKDLVQALVTNKVAAERGTDLMQNKGNGLIILLHGGPGTGKTFTAESVAEIAEKPLYPVTCGDIGTKPEDVEKYLESVFHLGKIWGCVVLLDEAEVFLEQRSLNDLARNALVSVFLRALEYYDGILILTSNRVGTFDEAFKSRIQLSLHYEPLTQPRRAQIWRNFFSRLESLGEDNIDFDDVENYITEISHREMNGRQIRNVITTARQWALFQNRTMTASHLKYAIKVTSKFDTYIKDVKEGFSDEQIARGDGVR